MILYCDCEEPRRVVGPTPADMAQCCDLMGTGFMILSEDDERGAFVQGHANAGGGYTVQFMDPISRQIFEQESAGVDRTAFLSAFEAFGCGPVETIGMRMRRLFPWKLADDQPRSLPEPIESGAPIAALPAPVALAPSEVLRREPDDEGNELLAIFRRSEAQEGKYVESLQLAKNLWVDKQHGIFKLESGRTTLFLPFDDIRWAYVQVDSKTVREGGLGSVLGRAAIGGVLAGGIGALIAGATTQSRTLKDVRTVALELGIPGFGNGMPFVLYAKTEFFHRFTPERAQEVAHEIIDLIEKSQRASRTSKETASAASTASIAGELQRLNELRLQGVITDEEFSSLKAKLIAAL